MLSDILMVAGMKWQSIVVNTESVEESARRYGKEVLILDRATLRIRTGQAGFDGPDRDLRARARAQLEHDVADMGLHRALGDDEHIGDSLIGFSTRYQDGYFTLTGRKFIHFCFRAGLFPEVPDDLARNLAAHGAPAPWLRIGALIACGAPLFGLLRFAPDLPVAAVLLGLATFCWGPYFALDRTLTQRLVPDDVRGRLVGLRMAVSSLGFPLGSAIGGALIGAAGAPTMILAVAAAYLALGSLPLLASGVTSIPLRAP